MGKIISVANQKGGVGKTTTSVNLSAALGVLEKKVLLIDADPQGNASSALGLEFNDNHKGLYDILSGSEPIKKVIQKSTSPNLNIIASNIDLVGIEIELINENKREYKLKSALDSISKNYDFIIIDCAPSLGLITINALTACNSVIVPIQCEYFALEGLGKLLNTIKSIQKLHNAELDIEGLLLTMFDTRLRLSNQVVDEVSKHFGEMVFKTIIKRNIKLGEAPGFGKDIISYDATSKGTKNYLSLANEIIQKNKN
jgi:chromosome partitioning protein